MQETSSSVQQATAVHIGALVLVLSLTLAAVCRGQPATSAADEHVDRMTQKALRADSHVERGSQLFDRHCTRCHGERASGDPNRGAPALAGQRFAYLVRQLANFTGDERDSATMHAVVRDREVRNPQAWADIAGYLNHLAATSSLQLGPAEDVKFGEAIFHEQCAACHAADAGGDVEGLVPSLRHQQYGYLLSQMHKLASGSRHNVDEGLVLFLRGFDEREMSATASYLSRLRGARQDRRQLREDGVAVD